jgi:hypothetical protein
LFIFMVVSFVLIYFVITCKVLLQFVFDIWI